jgi:uncharacterized membrane protein
MSALVVFLVLAGWIMHLQGRVDELERKQWERGGALREPLRTGRSGGRCFFRETSGPQASTHISNESAASFRPEVSATRFSDAWTPNAPAEADWAERFVAWMKEDWLLKFGALFLLMGFGWFVTYAFLNDWIGPAGRIAFGLTLGGGLMGFGWTRMREYVHQGGVFLALGAVTVLLTTFVARETYGFFSPSSALAMMFAAAAFIGFASVRYRAFSLALTGLVLAGLAPLLTNAPAPDPVGLFAYLFAVVLGVIWIVATTGWKKLTAASLLLVFLYSLPYLTGFGAGSEADRRVLLFFEYAFAAVFAAATVWSMARFEKKQGAADIVTALGNAMLALAWIVAAVPQKEWRVFFILCCAAVAFVVAAVAGRIAGKRAVTYLHGGIGTMLVAAATAVQWSGAALTVAYTFESALACLLSYAVFRNAEAPRRAAWLLLGPALLSLESMTNPVWKHSILHKHAFALLVLLAVLAALGAFFRRKADESGSEQERESLRRLSGVLLVAASLYAYALVWLSLHAVFLVDTATLFSLLAYTVSGLAAYASGETAGRAGLRTYGSAVLGLVAARLLLVDVWTMHLLGRILTFALVGTLLMSTAFLRKRREDGPAAE